MEMRIKLKKIKLVKKEQKWNLGNTENSGIYKFQSSQLISNSRKENDEPEIWFRE